MHKKVVNIFYFILFAGVLASCGDNMCYEENDIGDFDKQAIEVKSAQTGCIWTDDGNTGVGNTVVTECLSEYKSVSISAGNCLLQGQIACLDLRKEALVIASDHKANLQASGINVLNCSTLSSADLEAAFAKCVSDCEESCTEETGSSYEPNWATTVEYYNDPTYSTINILPNGQIKIQAMGSLTLKKANEQSILFNVDTNKIQDKPSGSLSPFITDTQNAFTIRGKWCMNGALSSCAVNNRNGFVSGTTDDKNYVAQNFLRRGIMILSDLPRYGAVNSNGDYIGPILEPNFSYWSCEKPTTSQGTNVFSDYNCDTNYDELSDTTYLTQNNELYPIEDTFSKNYGGYVVPSNVINFITPDVPFQTIVCQTNSDNQRECYNSTLNNENDKIEPWTSNNIATGNNLNNIMKGDLLLTSDGLEKSFLYPSKLALKIPVSSTNLGSCTVTVSVGSDSYTMNLPIDNKWHFLLDNNQEDILLNKSRYNTVSDNGQQMQDISSEQLYTVNIDFNDSETWTDENGNTINCGDGVVAFFIPQNEILINKSGFVSFKNLFNPTLPCNSSTCVDGNVNLTFNIINPLYNNRSNTLDTILPKNFYEYVNNNNNLSPEIKTIPISLSNTTSSWSDEIFVRKGQILRFDESNWYDINKNLGTITNKTINLGNGIFKNFSHGLVLKIEPRLALFCSYGAEEETSIYYDDEGSEQQMSISAPQCYDLEEYQGAFRSLFSGETKGDMATYGKLTIDSYDLGARKIASISQNQTYGNFSTFSYDFNESSSDFVYITDYVLPANKYLRFLVLDNTNFNFTSNTSNNNGSYQIVFQPIEYLTNGQQLAVVLADKTWNGKDSSGSWSKTTNPVAWLTKYNMDDSSENYGMLEETGSNYEFNNLGWLVKKGTSNYVIDVSSENFPNLSNIKSDEYSDLRLFFKIIDKYETCGNKKGANITSTLCKCSGESDTFYRSCYNISCNGENIIQKEVSSCNNDIYANNSGLYKVQIESSNNGNSAVNAVEKFLSSVLMEKLFNIFDGTNVRLKVDSQGNKEYCTYETSTNNYCSIFYEDNQTFRLNPGDSCVAADNEGQVDGAKYCYNNCNSLTTNEQQRTLCKTFNDGKGFVKKFYQSIISDNTYQRIVTTSFALMFSFYGLYFLLGLADFNQEELIKRLIKISFIYLMISPTGWNYYNEFFVKFFKDGIDYLSFAIVSSFADDISISNAMATANYSDKSVIFSSIDSSLQLIFSDRTASRIWGLLFSTLPGFVYIILIYWAVGLFLFSVITAMVIYSMSQVLISFFLAFGPIFFVCLIFDKTKGMFDKWLSNLIGLSFEQIFVLTCASFFNVILYNILKAIFSYKVCYESIFSIGRLEIIKFWRASDSDIPGLFQILLIFLIAHLSKNFVKLMANLGAGIGGADITSTDLSGGIVDTATGFVKPAVKMAQSVVKKGAVGMAKKMGYQSKDELDEENDRNERIRKEKQKALKKASNKASLAMAERYGENWRNDEEHKEEITKAFNEELESNFIDTVSSNGALIGDLAKHGKNGMTAKELFESDSSSLYSSSSMLGLIGNQIRSGISSSKLQKDKVAQKSWKGQTKEEKKLVKENAKNLEERSSKDIQAEAERLSRNSEDIFDENPNKDVDDEVDTGNSEGEEKK